MSADARALVAVLALIVLASAADAAQPAPGVKRVCVPAEDGRTWDCGTADDPPPQRPVAPRDSPPPPAFLAAPGAPQITPIEEAPAAEPEPIAERPRTDDFPDAPDRDDEAASTEEVAASEVPVEEPEPEAAPQAEAVAEPEPAAVEPVAESSPGEASSSSPPPFIAAPQRRGYTLGPPLAPDAPSGSTPVAERQAAASEASTETQTAATESQAETPSESAAPAETEPAVETAAAEPATAEPALAAEPDPEPAPLYTDALPLDADAFLALDGAGYTVQLAHAPTPDGFPALLAELGIDPATAYALPTPRNGAPWWTLAWSSFPDAAAARAALATLPRNAGVNVGYPRRIALMQNTLRR